MSDDPIADVQARINAEALPKIAEWKCGWASFVLQYPKKAAECEAQWGGAPEGITIKDGLISPWPTAMADGAPVKPATEAPGVFDWQAQAKKDSRPIVPETEAEEPEHHHPSCPVLADNGKRCMCQFLRNWDKETAESEAQPGQVIQMAVDAHGELTVLTSKGRLFRQHVQSVQRGSGKTTWTWTPIPVPTADNTPPLEEEKQDGKEGT